MPVYNGGRFLQASIESIIKQSFTDFDFIIINDGSTDNSKQIIDHLASKDRRVKIINNKTNIGITKSLNQGLAIAQGKYIARQDSDDISQPDRLKNQWLFLENRPDIFLCGTNITLIDSYGSIISNSFGIVSNHNQIAAALPKDNPIFHPTIMFRNENVRYREKFIYGQDYDLYLNLLTSDKKMANVDQILVQRRYSPATISANQKKRRALFAATAQKFYHQRLNNNNKDDYNLFNPDKIIMKLPPDNGEKESAKAIMEIILKTGQFHQMQKYLKQSRHLMTSLELLPFQICAHLPFIYKTYRKIFYGK